MTADPSSWKAVERGWKVVGRDGEEIGKVQDVAGDANRDIFNGLAVSGGLFSSTKYLPAERVAGIYEGRVETDLAPHELDELEPYE